MWFQRSREEWIRSGERNTKFYHAAIRIRQSMKKIDSLKNERGDWISEPEMFEEVIQNYFQALFKKEASSEPDSTILNVFPRLRDDHRIMLMQSITRDEIRDALFNMNPFKSLGKDGFHAGFYQKTWDIVSPSMCDLVLKFLNTGVLPDGLSETILTLIPKVLHPENISQFRPISLSNVGYKLITKTLTNILKQLVPSLISHNQCSFVLGR